MSAVSQPVPNVDFLRSASSKVGRTEKVSILFKMKLLLGCHSPFTFERKILAMLKKSHISI